MNKNKTLYWSDIHFGHKNILEYCNRPFNTIEDHDEYYINLWNNHISKNDIIFYVGDFLFGSKQRCKEILDRLNGIKYLIRGNHDRFTINKYIEYGFKNVFEYKINYINGKNVLISHYPYIYIDKLKNIYDENNCVLNIHGHIHGKNIDNTTLINVSCDYCKIPFKF